MKLLLAKSDDLAWNIASAMNLDHKSTPTHKPEWMARGLSAALMGHRFNKIVLFTIQMEPHEVTTILNRGYIGHLRTLVGRSDEVVVL